MRAPQYGEIQYAPWIVQKILIRLFRMNSVFVLFCRGLLTHDILSLVGFFLFLELLGVSFLIMEQRMSHGTPDPHHCMWQQIMDILTSFDCCLKLVQSIMQTYTIRRHCAWLSEEVISRCSKCSWKVGQQSMNATDSVECHYIWLANVNSWML